MLGYKLYNCEIICGRVKLPSKAFIKNGSRLLQIMEFKNVQVEFFKQWNLRMWITETFAYLKYYTSQ